MIEIRIDPAQLDAARRKLAGVPYAMQRAIMPAVGEVLRDGAAYLADHLQTEVPLPPKMSARAVRVSGLRLVGDAVIGEITVRSPHLRLIHYDVRPSAVTARRGTPSRRWPGFTFALRAGERRASEDLPTYGGGTPFIARMPGGHLGVYYRTGRRTRHGREQLQEKYGPDVQYHVATPEVEQGVIDRASLRFPAVLARYVDQALATHAAGGY